MSEENNKSEVARLRGQIRAQNWAARWAITGLAAGTAQHAFITRRFRQMDEYYNKLAGLVGEQEATQIVIEITDEKDEKPEGGKEA